MKLLIIKMNQIMKYGSEKTNNEILKQIKDYGFLFLDGRFDYSVEEVDGIRLGEGGEIIL